MKSEKKVHIKEGLPFDSAMRVLLICVLVLSSSKGILAGTLKDLEAQKNHGKQEVPGNGTVLPGSSKHSVSSVFHLSINYIGVYDECSKTEMLLEDNQMITLREKAEFSSYSCKQFFKAKNESSHLYLRCEILAISQNCNTESLYVQVDGGTSTLICWGDDYPHEWFGKAINLQYSRRSSRSSGGYLCSLVARQPNNSIQTSVTQPKKGASTTTPPKQSIQTSTTKIKQSIQTSSTQIKQGITKSTTQTKRDIQTSTTLKQRKFPKKTTPTPRKMFTSTISSIGTTRLLSILPTIQNSTVTNSKNTNKNIAKPTLQMTTQKSISKAIKTTKLTNAIGLTPPVTQISRDTTTATTASTSSEREEIVTSTITSSSREIKSSKTPSNDMTTDSIQTPTVVNGKDSTEETAENNEPNFTGSRFPPEMTTHFAQKQTTATTIPSTAATQHNSMTNHTKNNLNSTEEVAGATTKFIGRKLAQTTQNDEDDASHLSTANLTTITTLKLDSSIIIPAKGMFKRNMKEEINEFLVSEVLASTLLPDTNTCITCGIAQREDDQAINGYNVKIKSYPWMVYILVDSNQGITGCGGALVSSRDVITSAHCLKNDIHLIYVGLGKNNILDKTEKGSVWISTKDFSLYENYNGLNLTGDIAVITLPQSVNFTDFIRPVCVPDIDIGSLEGSVGTVLDWGLTSYDGSISTILQEVHLTIWSNEECSSEWLIFGITLEESQMCAWVEGKDSCLGDSGGPLFVQIKDQWILAGIVSYGFRCAYQRFPGVYTRVSEFRDWIHETTYEQLCETLLK